MPGLIRRPASLQAGDALHTPAGPAPPACWQDDAQGDGLSGDRLPEVAEIVVVGGGVMGTAVAYWLARAGRRVALIEERRAAWGASGRNAGLLLAGSAPLEDPALVRSVLHDDGIDAGLEQSGHLALASSPEVWEAFRAEVARRPPTAPPLQALDRAACEELLSMAIAPGYLGGRWLPGGCTIHPVRFVRGLLAATRRRGAIVVDSTRVLDVQPRPSRDDLRVRTTHGEIGARQVVLACNSATVMFAPGLRRRLTPVRGQMLATTPVRPLWRPGLAVDFGTAYWRQLANGTIVLGGLRSRDPVPEETSRPLTNRRIQQALTGLLPSIFPGMPAFGVHERWAGIMDVTPDGRPLIGALPGAPNQWVICGFAGHGLPGSLGAGRALAEAITTERTPSVLQPYAPDRFAASALA